QLAPGLGERLEAEVVDRRRWHVEPVPRVVPDEGRLVADAAPQPRDVALQRAGRGCGRLLAPDGVDDGVDRHRPARGDEEHGEERARLVATDVDGRACTVHDLEWTEQAEAHEAEQ